MYARTDPALNATCVCIRLPSPMALPSRMASAGCIPHRRSTLLGIRAPQPFTPSSPPAFLSCSPAHRSHPPHAHAVGAVSKCTRSFNRYRSPYSKHSIIETLHDEYTDGRWLTYMATLQMHRTRGAPGTMISRFARPCLHSSQCSISRRCASMRRTWILI
ncbi:hypothetical protein DFH08DRAFT_314830 [Mycena albidolilacea]|uniref:Uncharacterized protein n=1 Tax=Mycena albidolilacea TaxID=1033008 RepID=A0AAD7EKS0_9AGAR|nr:hypothetical protein DFH08DRAFT_314830 [Mycena albidolilacea]